jgi:hypothetical protein
MDFIQGFGIVLLIAISLFVIGIIIFIVTRRAGGVTIPAALMPSRKTFLNFLLIFGSYLICLLALSALWPDAWHAWRGKGFWITQLLLMSVAGFLASRWIGTHGMRWVAWIPGAMAILLTVATVSNNWPSKDDGTSTFAKFSWWEDVKSTFSKPEPVKAVVAELPAQYDSTITLMKGDTLRKVDVPVGYECFCSSGGSKEKPKRYYHQNQNEEPEIWGDGSSHIGGTGAYFHLSYLDKQITIVCTFKKIEEKKGEDDL